MDVLEYILLLCGDCGMVTSTMLNVIIMIMIIMTKGEDNEHPMPYMPKRKRPLRHIGINIISKGIKLLCQYVKHHINNMTISRKYTNKIKFKRNNKDVRKKSSVGIWLLHCHMHTMNKECGKGTI